MFVGQDHHADALSDLGAVGSEQEVNLVCLIGLDSDSLQQSCKSLKSSPGVGAYINSQLVRPHHHHRRHLPHHHRPHHLHYLHHPHPHDEQVWKLISTLNLCVGQIPIKQVSSITS